MWLWSGLKSGLKTEFAAIEEILLAWRVIITFFFTLLILYLLLHTSRYLDHPCDCESFRAGHSRVHLEQGLCEAVEWIGTKQGEIFV